jgi:hypothetical protein
MSRVWHNGVGPIVSAPPVSVSEGNETVHDMMVRQVSLLEASMTDVRDVFSGGRPLRRVWRREGWFWFALWCVPVVYWVVTAGR